MNLTRRRLLITTAGLAVTATGLSACNASAGQEAGSSPTEATEQGAETGAFPVTIPHKYGETAIAAEPRRIVCVGLKEQDDLLALGIVPVGATKWLEFPDGNGIIGPWAKEALGSSPAPTQLDNTDGIPFEAIAGLQPDLILALYAGPTKDDFTKLSAIANTVVLPNDYVDYGIPWDVQAEIVGRAVGRPGAMAEKVASSKKALTDAAGANPAFSGKTAMVITPYEGLWVYGAQDPRVRLMNELGFVNPSGFDDLFPADSDSFGANISPEKAEVLDVDTLVCFADEGEQQAQIETKLFKTQDVYTQGRTVWLRTADLGTTPFSFLTALSLPYLLDAFVPRVAAAVDGDPATSTAEVV